MFFEWPAATVLLRKMASSSSFGVSVSRVPPLWILLFPEAKYPRPRMLVWESPVPTQLDSLLPTGERSHPSLWESERGPWLRPALVLKGPEAGELPNIRPHHCPHPVPPPRGNWTSRAFLDTPRILRGAQDSNQFPLGRGIWLQGFPRHPAPGWCLPDLPRGHHSRNREARPDSYRRQAKLGLVCETTPCAFGILSCHSPLV